MFKKPGVHSGRPPDMGNPWEGVEGARATTTGGMLKARWACDGQGWTSYSRGGSRGGGVQREGQDVPGAS